MNLTAIALRMILTLAPVEQPREVLPGWVESPNARMARYVVIAEDVASAAEFSCSGRKPQNKQRCEIWTTAYAVGTAKHESDFAPDVDLGECYRGKDGKSSRCDSGLSVSMWQIRVGGEEGKLYRHDRRAAAIEAIRRMNRSMNACQKLPVADRLSAYAGGRCEGATAILRSRELWALIEKAYNARGMVD